MLSNLGTSYDQEADRYMSGGENFIWKAFFIQYCMKQIINISELVSL